MKKGILKLSVEIMIAIAIAFASYNVFADGKNISEVVSYNSSNKQVEINEIRPLNLSYMFPMSDNDALNNLEKSEYEIINNNNNMINYRVMYRISNDIDYNYFNYYFMLNDTETINKFANTEKIEKDGYTDIILYEGVISENNKINFNYLMWLDESIGNEAQNISFTGEIVVETY